MKQTDARAFLEERSHNTEQALLHSYVGIQVMEAYAETRTAELVAEVERLKAALKRIAKYRRFTIPAYAHCRKVASEALKETSK
jgi:hypothetical protein